MGLPHPVGKSGVRSPLRTESPLQAPTECRFFASAMAMAKKRNMRGYRRLPFRFDAGVGAITVSEFSGIDLGSTVNERMYLSSVVTTVGTEGFTTGEGPFVVYVAHSDYTNTEVEEAIKATNSWDMGDLVAREQANRKVRLVAEFSGTAADQIANDGKPIKVKLGFTLEEGDTLQWGVFAAADTITTGGSIVLAGHVNGWAR